MTGAADDTLTEYIDVPDDETQAIPLDGTTMVRIGDAGESDPGRPADEFYANLADGIVPETILDRIALDLMRKIEEDKKAREMRDKQYEEGIKRTGLGKEAPGGADFEGASKVVHPGLTEATIDYESRVIKELWPPSGPVKPRIIGESTKEKAERAQRKVDHMNWQLRTQIAEAFGVMETTLTQVPLGGVQYIEQWWDHRLNRPRWQFVPVDNTYLPFGAVSWHSSHRRTIREDLSEVEYRQRVEGGMYRDLKLSAPAAVPEGSKAETATRKVEGVDDDGMNVDGIREVYKTLAYLDVTEEMADILNPGWESQVDEDGNPKNGRHQGLEIPGKLFPYLISIDVQSKKTLAFYRDWEANDPRREPIDHVFEFPFIPWRGALSIGFPQIIGGLSGAATGALRALLDSAHAANVMSGLIKKGSGVSGQSRHPSIGELAEIDGGLEADDIRKVVMPFPFPGPNTVLLQLLEFLVGATKGVVRTSLDETAMDSNANTPVGTQLSRVEEGMTVFSAIHGRIHNAFNRLLMGLHRLNRLYLPETLRADLEGKELFVRRADYDGPLDVQPVSDPTIYSAQQRFYQGTAIQQRAAAVPGLYKTREVELWFLKDILKIPDAERFLVDAPQPHELNAVNENLAMVLGRPVTPFPMQDHLAHIQVHLSFIESPLFGMNPLIAGKFLPPALMHVIHHMAYYYVSHMVATVEHAANQKVAELFDPDPQVKAAFDRLLAQASQTVMPQVVQALQGAEPVLMKAMQLVQQLQPKPPVDPGQAALQVAQGETARKAASDQQQATIDAQKNAIDASRVQVMRDNANTAAQARIVTTQMDNQTAEQIAESREAMGAAPGFSTGESLTGA